MDEPIRQFLTKPRKRILNAKWVIMCPREDQLDPLVFTDSIQCRLECLHLTERYYYAPLNSRTASIMATTFSTGDFACTLWIEL